jgi:serine protease inhibitor
MVDVTESGTQATAATGAVFATRSMLLLDDPVQVRADRPFVWAIVDGESRGVLFAGVVNDPHES